MHLLRQCASFQFHDTSDTAAIKLSWDVTDSRHLRSNGGNLAAVLLHLRENHFKRYDLIERQIRRLLPTFGGFVLEPAYGKVLLQWRSRTGGKTFGAHLTSDGSLRLFCLVTLLTLPDAMLPDVMLIDEPELGLHPAAITLVSEMVTGVAQRRQVILSTQSPYLVDCFSLDDIVVADLDKGATRLRLIDAAAYQAWLDDEYSPSDLWLQNVIGGRP
jgi:predicted ATPase